MTRNANNLLPIQLIHRIHLRDSKTANFFRSSFIKIDETHCVNVRSSAITVLKSASRFGHFFLRRMKAGKSSGALEIRLDMYHDVHETIRVKKSRFGLHERMGECARNVLYIPCAIRVYESGVLALRESV